MASQPVTEINIPNVRLELDQLLAAIRKLDKPARIKAARTLAETEMDSELAELIEQLAKNPGKPVSDSDIHAEIMAARQSHKQFGDTSKQIRQKR